MSNLSDSGSPPWRVIDLFSGAGGMSYGFHAHSRFSIVGAADAEIGKPSTGFGALDCNGTYVANIGVVPEFVDLGTVDPHELADRFKDRLPHGKVDVLAACPPCTGFSRAVASNHLRDDPRNSLVSRTALFVREFDPRVVVMENARELLIGNFRSHFEQLREDLDALGYEVLANTHMLSRFGLPQVRERALVVAAKRPLRPRDLDDLWKGYEVSPDATTVRRAIAHLAPIEAGGRCDVDPAHTATFTDGVNLRRLQATPTNGGSWVDWIQHSDADELLIPAMKRSVQAGTLNHFCDVYGRMAWDRPAPTIKRECSHMGNGRYSHPEQHRLCSVREMAILQGFPDSYRFTGRSRKNMYRAIGDAVPPLVSYQLAHLVEWILTGRRPELADALLPGCHVAPDDLIPLDARRREDPQPQLVLFSSNSPAYSASPPE